MEVAVIAAPSAGPSDASARLAVGLLVMFLGAFLIAWIGMFATLKIQSARGRRRSRSALWLGAASAATLAFAGFVIYGLARVGTESLSKVPQQIKTARDTTEIRLPPVLERMAGGKERIKAQQELTKGVVESPAFLWWSIVVGTSMMCVIQGSIIGTIAWTLALVGGRIVLGRWPLGAQPDALSPRPGSPTGHEF